MAFFSMRTFSVSISIAISALWTGFLRRAALPVLEVEFQRADLVDRRKWSSLRRLKA
jgi:hypothetical protein